MRPKRESKVVLTPCGNTSSDTDKVSPAPNEQGEEPTCQLTWLIFGATGHYGRNLCRTALAKGDRVCATSVNIESEGVILPEWQDSTQIITKNCDVRCPLSVKECVDYFMWQLNKQLYRDDEEKSKFKQFQANNYKGVGSVGFKFDIVVNCIGTGIVGACEEQTEYEVRSQMEINFMGFFNIVKAVLPPMTTTCKASSSSGGKIIVFTSLAGSSAFPGMGPYSAAKWAVEGFTESISFELDKYGIYTTIIQTGGTHDDEPGQPQHFTFKQCDNSVYTGTPATYSQRILWWSKRSRTSSAVTISKIVWELAHDVLLPQDQQESTVNEPPIKLALGSQAIETERDKARQMAEEVEAWKFLFDK